MIIKRWEAGALKRMKGWCLVYGRRKVGKTFLLKNYLPWKVYMTVSRGGLGIVEIGKKLEQLPWEDGLKIVLSKVEEGATCVIDEFQRLPEQAWDLISVHANARGRLFLCGSSFSVAGKVFGRRSPLLGLLAPFQVGLVSPTDVLKGLKGLRPAEAVKWGSIVRDPWILRFLEPEGDVAEALLRAYPTLAPACVGLVGEVFYEEERELTRLYEAVLRLLSMGYWSAKDVAQKLFEAKLLERPEAGVASGLLNRMSSMGLVQKVRLWRTRGSKTFYRHSSSLLSVLLYLDERYGDLAPKKEDFESKLGIEYQFFVGELLAEVKGLRLAYSISPKGDIDVVLMKDGRPYIGYEVKSGPFTKGEEKAAVKRIRALGIAKAGLVSLARRPSEGDENLGPKELVELAQKKG